MLSPAANPFAPRLSPAELAALPAEQRALAERLGAFALPGHGVAGAWPPLDRAGWAALGAAGLLGVGLPKEAGGGGAGAGGSALLARSLVRAGGAGLLLGVGVQADIAPRWLLLPGRAELATRWLPGLLDGTVVACQADTDPAPDRPVTAVFDGGDVVLNGSKHYVINAASADVAFVGARLGGAAALVLVPLDTPGVTVRAPYDKWGTRAVDSAAIDFAGARVPASHLLSQRGIGQLLRWNRVMARMRFLVAAGAAAFHAMLLERVQVYVKVRPLGGRPLGAWPVNAHALARARADLELMEAGIRQASRAFDGGRAPVSEVAQLKWFCVERATAFAGLCADLEGGAGYMRGTAFALDIHAELRGLRMASGSQTTMLTVANHTLACRAELASAPGEPRPTSEEEHR
ncbi:acyl-CoA dehydrogenase [Streptomyces sp. NPDC026589]|uniref:acyl-CoA dehydrogenase family protein n=1 Tax=Streptomyces sp. NPDC026589 TaxID=3155609 RepID=UPI003401BF41